MKRKRYRPQAFASRGALDGVSDACRRRGPAPEGEDYAPERGALAQSERGGCGWGAGMRWGHPRSSGYGSSTGHTSPVPSPWCSCSSRASACTRSCSRATDARATEREGMMMDAETPAYGLWLPVVANAALFILFAFSFTRPRTRRDWQSFGAFSAFIVALFTGRCWPGSATPTGAPRSACSASCRSSLGVGPRRPHEMCARTLGDWLAIPPRVPS